MNCPIDYWFILLMGPSSSGKTHSAQNDILGANFNNGNIKIPKLGFAFDGGIFRDCILSNVFLLEIFLFL